MRESTKMEKQEKVEKNKIKLAIKKGNLDGAKIYAENAIRSKNQALNYLRLSSRIDAVANRVETAVRMNQVTKSMSGIVNGMDQVLKTMDTEKITQIMDKFEKQFDDLDVQSSYMEGAMSTTTSSMTPVDQVDSLISQVAEENGLELKQELGNLPCHNHSQEHVQEDDLSSRLDKLKQK
eukprot:TRINITY_DN1664_c0_g2_i1.p1 TRINITY_DN1664_c0_g2~~TRINITY_DN1664_c0_g2_i1.p1  ORF type:complete len:203 (-),score=49.22 TRINITY_DN1664_c0_g2_i1:284-820(-)